MDLTNFFVRSIICLFLWRYEGNVDASGKMLTLDADGPNFMGEGKLTKFQDIYAFDSADEILITSRMLGTDGQCVALCRGPQNASSSNDRKRDSICRHRSMKRFRTYESEMPVKRSSSTN
ncbi:MAG TPA: hypothetical protein DDZ51_29855 [Planctomycetaceae bacterium]|nr:hypothetical protein [Planctomycetaceae bacterium]